MTQQLIFQQAFSPSVSSAPFYNSPQAWLQAFPALSVLSFNPLSCSPFPGDTLLPPPQGSPLHLKWSALSFLPQGSHMHSVRPFLFQREADKPQEIDTPPSQEDTLESYGFPKLAFFLGAGAQQNYLGYVFVFQKNQSILTSFL